MEKRIGKKNKRRLTNIPAEFIVEANNTDQER